MHALGNYWVYEIEVLGCVCACVDGDWLLEEHVALTGSVAALSDNIRWHFGPPFWEWNTNTHTHTNSWHRMKCHHECQVAFGAPWDQCYQCLLVPVLKSLICNTHWPILQHSYTFAHQPGVALGDYDSSEPVCQPENWSCSSTQERHLAASASSCSCYNIFSVSE